MVLKFCFILSSLLITCSVSLPLLVGSEVLGTGYDYTTGNSKYLPVVKLNYSENIDDNDLCSSYVSLRLKNHCFHNYGNGRNYVVPYLCTAYSQNEYHTTQLDVNVIQTVTDFDKIHHSVVVDEDDGWFGTEITTTIEYQWYFLNRARSIQSAYVFSVSEIYSIELDEIILKLIAKESPTQYLDQHFIDYVHNLPDIFDVNNSTNVLDWFDFFYYYGTHVISSVTMGGSMHMRNYFNQCFLSTGFIDVSLVTEFSSFLFSAYLTGDFSFFADINLCFLQNSFTSFSYYGGVGYNYSPKNSSEWQQSIFDSPYILKKSVINIGKFVALVDSHKLSPFNQAMNKYLEKSSEAKNFTMEQIESFTNSFNVPCCSGNLEDEENEIDICNSVKFEEIAFNCQDILHYFFKKDEKMDDFTYSNTENIYFGPDERNLPNSVVWKVGYDYFTGDCKKNIIDDSYKDKRIWLNPQTNITYKVPDQAVVTGIGDFQNSLNFVKPIVDINAWLKMSAFLEFDLNVNLFSIIAIILPFFDSNAVYGDLTAQVAAALEAEGKVILMVNLDYEAIELSQFPYSTFEESQQSSKFTERVNNLPPFESDLYEQFICDYGTRYITSAVYGGSAIFSFKIDADVYASAAAWFDARIRAALNIWQCFFGWRNGITFNVNFGCVFPEPDFWAQVEFSITITGGKLTELLDEFKFESWMNSVSTNPGLLRMKTLSISELLPEPQASLLNSAINQYGETGNLSCSRGRIATSSSCYPALGYLPQATFICNIKNLRDCMADLRSCCTLKM